MPSDISRRAVDRAARYQGVIMQQGRVILDRDFNAQSELTDAHIAADALDFVGPCGTPNNGFAIAAPLNPASPPLWSPPAPLIPAAAQARDFAITPGTMYVGGQRANFPAARFGLPAIGYSYFNQPDWIHPELPIANAAQEFIYLHLHEQAVSAVEDPDLRDVALGGPDTTARTRLLQRVKRMLVTSADIVAALSQAQSSWLANGFALNTNTMRLLPQVALQVSFTGTAATTNPCDPITQGGYLGAENQAIRVQITDGGVAGATPKLLWGYDNASFLYRTTLSNSTTILLGTSPIDAFHMPKQGQVVEILRSALIIESDPDVTSTQKATIVRCVAESTGVIRTLTKPYQPDTRTLALDSALPADYLSDTNPLFVRIWQSELTLTADGKTPTELTDTSTGATTGIQVTLTASTTNANRAPIIPIGAYWTFAVRPSTPQGVYPEAYLLTPQQPDGPRQWVCPLATVDWQGQALTSPPTSPPTTGPIVHDAREQFDNLVELTKRNQSGCCTVTLRPEDLTADPLTLQKAVDRFASAAQGVSICLAPGKYLLTQPLTLDVRHSGITIEACHGGATLQAAATADMTQFFQGLLVMAATANVTLRGIRFTPPSIPLVASIAKRTDSTNLRKLADQLGTPNVAFGIRMLDCTDVKVFDCDFQLAPTASVANIAAGIFASGNATGLKVTGSTFTGPARLRLLLPINLTLLDKELLTRVNVAPVTSTTFTPITATLFNPVLMTETLNINPAITAAATTAATTPAPAATPTTIAPAASTSTLRIASPALMSTLLTNNATTAATTTATTPPLAATVIQPIVTPIAVPVSTATAATSAAALNLTASRISLTNLAQTVAIQPGIVSQVDPALLATVINPVAVTPPQVMLAAILIAPSLNATFTSPIATVAVSTAEPALLAQAVIDRLEFSDNRLSGLTIGILTAAATGTGKIRNNLLTDCIGGIWTAALNQDNVAELTEFQNSLLNFVQQGTPAGRAIQVASLFPLPQPSTITARVTLSAQLLIADNHIDALPGDGSTSGPACFFYVVAPPASAAGAAPIVDVNTSFLFTTNHVRNISAAGTATTVVSGLYGATALFIGASNNVIGNNLIHNMQTTNTDSRVTVDSLIIVPAVGGDMAVTGNILKGVSNLLATRDDIPTISAASLKTVPELAEFTNWKFHNNTTP